MKGGRNLWIVVGLGLAVWLLFFRKAAAAAAAPSVLGDVSSGDASATIETNVLNPNFGLQPGDVDAGSATP